MKESYSIKSDRYNHVHTLKRNGDGTYSFIPQESWMPLYITYDNDNGKIAIVDTDGGPCLCKGWRNEEIELVDIDDKGNFTIKEI